MDHAERVAKALIETLIPGAKMVYREAQHDGSHDFDLAYEDGSTVPVEVTISTDQVKEAAYAAIRDPRKGGSVVKRIRCQSDWIVHPTPLARVNRIRDKVDDYLASIEEEGLDSFHSDTDAFDYPSVARIQRDLRIKAGSKFQWKTPHSIVISPPGGGGRTGAQHVQTAVETEARKPDNRRKLARAAAPEGHLFVYVDSQNFLAWVAIRDLEPPPNPPLLPEEVTVAWVAASHGGEDRYIVWRASNDSWDNLGVVTIQT